MTPAETIDYYNSNAEAFQKRTLECPVQTLHDAFLAQLPPGAHILDAGCGPGRDTRVFLSRGFRVTATDASKAMVELAMKSSGQHVLHIPFQSIDFEATFEGIWASASLLHVPRAEIDDVLRRLIRALKPGGVIYMSLKVGEGERTIADGRRFYDYTQQTLRAVLKRHAEIEIVEMRESPPAKGQADPNPWLHATVKKMGAA